MSKIFDDNFDLNENFKTNNEYAKNYNKWRKKEELNKLKTKYGEDIEQDESSSSSDDEEAVELTPAFEKDFYKTLSLLKNKDPRIYDENVHFFQQEAIGEKKDKKKKDQPMYLKDYERNIILERGGELSDEEGEIEDDYRSRSPTYVEEQKQIKEGFKKIIENSDEEDEDGIGGLLKQRQKTKEDLEKEDAEYINWLAGQKTKLDDKEVETELKPLKDYWNKPDLDEGEKFLRDYILNKKFLNKDDDDYVPTYDEIVHDSDQDLSNDEEYLEKQEEFEHKYNFRFEEPDQEFIKRYPRTMENSLRKTDDRRKVKRQEIKERKQKEKVEKMQEIKKLQEMKRLEIEEKLEKLKEITGNASLGFEGEDIDGDFDPEEHDRKMQALFNEEFYSVEEGDQKPVFPELDEELEIENWERYNGENEEEVTGQHCEDENFNMDCDYDPQASTQNQLIENSKGKKKRKRKSKFAVAVSKPKPKYDPNDKNYEKYFDEYYKLDCEDIIGDIPCRFKYRKVVPNDFGLTTEEILLANERELNKWCSLKKAVQIRPDHVEKYDQIAYQKKAQNINLKKRILPSLFSNEQENAEKSDSQNERVDDKLDKKGGETEKDDGKSANENGSLKKKRKKKKLSGDEKSIDVNETAGPEREVEKENISAENAEEEISEEKQKKEEVSGAVEQGKETAKTVKNRVKNKKKKKSVPTNSVQIQNSKKRKRNNTESIEKKSKKVKKSKQTNDKVTSISDARLSAYGINPKKFKNKLKYAK